MYLTKKEWVLIWKLISISGRKRGRGKFKWQMEKCCNSLQIRFFNVSNFDSARILELFPFSILQKLFKPPINKSKAKYGKRDHQLGGGLARLDKLAWNYSKNLPFLELDLLAFLTVRIRHEDLLARLTGARGRKSSPFPKMCTRPLT